MKRHILTLIPVLSIALLQVAAAHEPVRMELRLDPERKVLGVRITHRVRNADTHYIENVRIEVDRRSRVFDYDSQPDENGVTRWYRLRADRDDDITVTAYCSIDGEITAELEFGKEIGVTVGSPPVRRHDNGEKAYSFGPDSWWFPSDEQLRNRGINRDDPLWYHYYRPWPEYDPKIYIFTPPPRDKKDADDKP